VANPEILKLGEENVSALVIIYRKWTHELYAFYMGEGGSLQSILSQYGESGRLVLFSFWICHCFSAKKLS